MMILDGTSMAGRTFMGLGSLLTGAKANMNHLLSTKASM